MKIAWGSMGVLIEPEIDCEGKGWRFVSVGAGLGSRTIKVSLQDVNMGQRLSAGLAVMKVAEAEELIRQLQVAVALVQGKPDPHGVLAADDVARGMFVSDVADAMRAGCQQEPKPEP